MTAGHAVFAPSSAHRWIACPASALLPADSGPKPAADRGRQLHAAAEMLLRLGASPSDRSALALALDSAELFDVTDDEQDAVSGYVAFVRERCLPGSQLSIEHRIALTPLTGEAGAHGTADAVIVTHDAKAPEPVWYVDVIDFKTGRVPVTAANNEQLMMYAAGIVREHQASGCPGPFVVTGWIYQPFVRAEPDSCRWTGDELLAWVDATVRPAVQAALVSQPPFNPGPKQCRWCPGAATCKALQEKVHASVAAAFPAFEQDGHALAELLDLAELAELWAQKIRTLGHQRLAEGVAIPGWALKDGRRTRTWADSEAAESLLVEMFGEAAFVRELISPAQAERFAKRKKLPLDVLQSIIAEKRGEPRLCRAAAPADPAFEPLGE